MEVPEAPRVRLVGDRVQANPLVGVMVADRLTAPVNPFTAVTVIVAVPVDPATKLTSVGLAVTVKSFTV